jgi:hypothetical protein
MYMGHVETAQTHTHTHTHTRVGGGRGRQREKQRERETCKQLQNIYTAQLSGKKVVEKNEILSFAGKWMELENIILSKVSQAQKTKNRLFSLICRL